MRALTGYTEIHVAVDTGLVKVHPYTLFKSLMTQERDVGRVLVRENRVLLTQKIGCVISRTKSKDNVREWLITPKSPISDNSPSRLLFFGAVFPSLERR